MKKLATILALLCAAAFAKEYEYMVQSMSYESIKERKESTHLSYDAAARKLEQVRDTNSSDGLGSSYKEISYFDEKGGMVKFEVFNLDLKSGKWKKIEDYTESVKDGVTTRETNSIADDGTRNASKTVSSYAGNATEDVRYKFVKGKWQKDSMNRSVKNAWDKEELTISFKWDGKSWQPKDKTEIFYDASGEMSGYVSYEFVNGAWQNSEREMLNGDRNGSYEQIRSTFQNGAWQNATMSKHELDAAKGEGIVTSFIWNDEKGAWDNMSKQTVIKKGADLNMTSYLWDERLKDWVKSYSNGEIYDKSGERLLEQSYESNSSNGKYVYSYDEHGSNTAMDIYKLDASDKWVQTGRSEATYDTQIPSDSVGHGAALMMFEMPSIYAITSFKEFKLKDGKYELITEKTWKYKKIK